MRKMCARWLLLLALMPAAAIAQISSHRIETLPANPTAGDAFQIRVSGNWPNACVPQPMPVVVSGRNIDLSVRSNSGICAAVVTPYSVTFDPSVGASPGFPGSSVYRVRYSVKDETTQATLLAFRLIDTSSGPHPVKPEAGFWTPDLAGEFLTSGSGIGFMVERQGGTLAMTTNAYTLGGQSAWYLSAGVVSHSSFRAELLRSIGGQPLWGTYRGPQAVEPAGSIDVEFTSDASGVVWFARPSGEGMLDALDLMPISVRRMNFALASNGIGLAGTWTYTASAPESSVSPVTMRLDYRADRSSSNEAVLVDSAKGLELRCAIDGSRRDGPPRSCQLRSNGDELARFDNNALSRLSGINNGAEVVLVRISD